MGRPDEHLNEIIMERVVKLPLKAPSELGIVEVAGMQIEIVGVNRNAFVFESDDNLDAVTFSARREGQQRVFVELKLGEDTVETRGFGHIAILAEG